MPNDFPTMIDAQNIESLELKFDRRDFFRLVGVAGAGAAALSIGDEVLAQEAADTLSHFVYLPIEHNSEPSVELNAALAQGKLITDYKMPLAVVDYSTWDDEPKGIEVTGYFNEVADWSTQLIRAAGFDPLTWDKIDRKFTKFIFEATDTGFASTQVEEGGAAVRIKLNKLFWDQNPLIRQYVFGNEIQHLLFKEDPNHVVTEWLSNMHAVNVSYKMGSQEQFEAGYRLATTQIAILNGSFDLLYITANSNAIAHPSNKSLLTFFIIEESQAAELTDLTYLNRGGVDLASVYQYIDEKNVPSMQVAIQQMKDKRLFTNESIALIRDHYAQVAFIENVIGTRIVYGYTLKTNNTILEPVPFAGNNNAQNLTVAIGYINKSGQRVVGVLEYEIIYDNDTQAGGVRIIYPETFVGEDGETYTTYSNGNTWYLHVRPEPDPSVPARTYSFPIGPKNMNEEESETELDRVRKLSGF